MRVVSICSSTPRACNDGTFVRKESAETFDAVIRTNLRSAFVVSAAVLPVMPAGGRIVFLSSSSAHEPHPGKSAYSASKAGLNAFAFALAQRSRTRRHQRARRHDGSRRHADARRRAFPDADAATPTTSRRRSHSSTSFRRTCGYPRSLSARSRTDRSRPSSSCRRRPSNSAARSATARPGLSADSAPDAGARSAESRLGGLLLGAPEAGEQRERSAEAADCGDQEVATRQPSPRSSSLSSDHFPGPIVAATSAMTVSDITYS